MQLTVVLKGSRLLFNSFLLRFKSKNGFILEICEVEHLKKKMLVSWKVKLFSLTGLFLPNLCSNRGFEWKIIGEMLESSLKNKSQNHLLEDIFQPPDSKV